VKLMPSRILSDSHVNKPLGTFNRTLLSRSIH
jgi:hypothetical protein